ncbi:MAG TPA: hypothetical protein VKB38_21725 [Terracidiphilus sp.]|nr:hypothetical protein [Terracidiphilus sp.]
MPRLITSKDGAKPSVLRIASRLAIRACGLAAVALTLYTGRHNHSILLIGLFVAWVASPFFGLFLGERAARRSPAAIASAIYAASLVLSICPVLVYSIAAAALSLHEATFANLAVPAASWLAIATLLVAAGLARKR